MPVRVGQADRSLVEVPRFRAGNSDGSLTEVEHIYVGLSDGALGLVHTHIEAPTITSLLVTPSTETAAERTARGASPQNTITWSVEETTPAQPPTDPVTYNYGAQLTVAIASQATAHRHGWSVTRGGGFGAISVTPTGGVDFINYFASTPTITVGDDLNTRYYVRFASEPPANPPTSILVDGISYPLVARNTLGNAGAAGYVTNPGVPAWSDGSTHNVQLTYADGTMAWPNTQSGTIPGSPGTPAVIPTLALNTQLEDGIVNNIPITQVDEGSVMVLTPRQDMTVNLSATNVDRTARLSAHYTYNVPAVIAAGTAGFSAAVTTVAGQPTPLADVNFSGRFNAHRINSATITMGSDSIDLLSGGGTRHLTGGTAPSWQYDLVTAQTRIRTGRTPGTAINRTATLSITSRDGTTATRAITVVIPA